MSTYSISKWLFCRRRIDSKNKAVLITGCGSGFGKELAKRLDAKGFQVFASCHYPEGEGVDDLKRSCSNKLKVFCLDVTNNESVEKAVEFVKSNLGSNELWAVVNNAGMTKAFTPFDFSSLDNFKETMDVNAFGPIRVTKAFLPLLKTSKGRIVNINSVLGRVCSVGTCTYVMSKYAAVGLTQCLSLEMKSWGVRVISVEPDAFRTGILNKEKVISRAQNEVSKVSKDITSSYGEKYIKKFEDFELRVLKLASNNIKNVIDAMESAVTLKNPCSVYTPCRNFIIQIFYHILQKIPFEIYEITHLISVRIFGYPWSKDRIQSTYV